MFYIRCKRFIQNKFSCVNFLGHDFRSIIHNQYAPFFFYEYKSPRKIFKNILNSWLMSKKSNEQRHRSNLYNNMRYLTSALLHIWHCNANKPHSTSVLRKRFVNRCICIYIYNTYIKPATFWFIYIHILYLLFLMSISKRAKPLYSISIDEYSE